MAKMESRKKGGSEVGHHGKISGGTGSGDNKMAGTRNPGGGGANPRRHGKLDNA